jgi:hypothetical protein
MPNLSIEDSSGKGKAIGKIDGGEDNGKIIFINIEDNNNNAETEEKKIVSMLSEIITDEVDKCSVDRRQRQRLNEYDTLRRSFMEDKPEISNDVRLNEIYQQIKSNYTNQIQKEYRCDGCMIKPIPDIETRECIYVAGPAGSGKSTYVRQYAQAYNKLFPRRPVYLFSKVANDTSLTDIKNLNVIDINEELYQEPIECDELKKSLCIFDDVSTISDKKTKTAVFDLINDILEIGRHSEIYICVTNHLLTDYTNTRTILNECTSITMFPTAGSSYQIKYVLKQYFGLDSKSINKILKLPSRYVTVYKKFPMTVMYQSGAYLL